MGIVEKKMETTIMCYIGFRVQGLGRACGAVQSEVLPG